MAPISADLLWYNRPLPAPVFSVISLASPLALPLAALLTTSWVYFQRQKDWLTAVRDPTFTDPLHHEVFDFIVIGAGSAGAVVANRLSKHNKVLLLEAGGDPNPATIVPVGVVLTVVSPPAVDWQYQTEPQKHAAYGFREQRMKWARAKALGGCSTINAMVYMRGSRQDFDNWANLTQDSSWSYKNLLSFFKKMENYKGNFPSDINHAKEGPINVEPLRYAPGRDQFLEAVKEAGYRVVDLNTPDDGEGFMPTELTQKRGRRADTYRSYIKPIMQRKNLKIYRFAHVIKVHIDRRRSAYGVTYVRHGITKFVRADKEIIVSAGAVNSPHLLLLSGIGPKKHLNSHGIKCRVHLPVGQNLQDHLFTMRGPVFVNESLSFMTQRNFSISAIPDYLLHGNGPLSFLPVSVTGAMSSSLAQHPTWPDIFVHQTAMAPSFGSGPIIRVAEEGLGLKQNIVVNYLEPFEGKDSFYSLVGIGRPFSRGEIRLRSKDPFKKPVIDPKYLSDPRDAKIMVEGIRKLEEIFNTPTFQRLNATMTNGPLPNCDIYTQYTDKYWDCYVRTFVHTAWHPCCTAPMLSRSGNTTTGVVDSKLRVLKTRNLRVVDASVMPVITNANLNAPTIMIGEKGSFMIRDHWAQQFLVCPNNVAHHVNPGLSDRMCFYSHLV